MICPNKRSVKFSVYSLQKTAQPIGAEHQIPTVCAVNISAVYISVKEKYL